MIQQLKNKIKAQDTTINDLLKNQKFYIDYFQREYRWKNKHIELLVEDLTSTFLKSYKEGDKRSDVANYPSYYLGPVVFSINTDNGNKSIIDGQQRITSLTLLLIYLNHLQSESDNQVNISELIYSEKFGEKSFNMTDDNRQHCLMELFDKGVYKVQEKDDETVKNIVARYNDIEIYFPQEISEHILPYFIDWFKENVILVEITAYSDDNAYLIFETMNDRGLNLTPSEMLKGYVLSQIKNKVRIREIDEIWKKAMKDLHSFEEDSDLTFFQTWFRGRYANTIRSGSTETEDKDFELIGTRFHSWFKENHKELFGLKTSDDFYDFFKNQFPFYVKCFIKLLKSKSEHNEAIPHLNYVKNYGIAD